MNSQHFKVGETILNPRVGDFFLVQRHTFFGRLIRFGQRLRFTKEEASWNHCGIFVSPTGDIIEALTSDVQQAHISKYTDKDYIVVHIDANAQDRDEILKFAQWAIGKEYGFLTDLNLALWCLFGGKFSFSLDGEMICSGLVAKALERAGYIFERDASHIMPADLARYFHVSTR